MALRFRIAFWSVIGVFAVVGSLPARADAPACPRHEAMQPSSRQTARSIHRYVLPSVALIDQDGRRTSIDDVFPIDSTLVVNFIFTTCSTICPVMSATFNGLRGQLGDEAAGVRFVSISIDPEHDRPAVLKEYAKRFGAPANWRFYTGSAEDIRSVRTAFEAFIGDKSNHRPFTLLRSRGSSEWIRIDGFASARELAEQLHEPVSAK